MPITHVGVVGCGLMGSGIAQVCADRGFPTVIMEVTPEFLDKGLTKIRTALGRAVEKGKMSADQRDRTLGKLRGTTSLEGLRECDLVIEAATEEIAAKRKIFSTLDSLCPAQTILASNTSSLCITEIAASTKRPDRVCGLHFFNPVPVMKLVEIVKTLTSSPQTIEAIRTFSAALGKSTILAIDTPGFIVNRILVPYLLDAVRMLENGVATREDIDTGMKLGCGHPMGPLELLDFVGLDTTFYIANIMFEEFREARYAPPPLLKRMVLAGHFGQKSGRGFYDYSAR
ncbi:MAG: 3-hydroxybutyryl-CoA dehydrogenase [Planctomycetes bacterium]|nr:3-hydroxybutyryl-CoA dehydrogenase [Planctomycetota bacterium]